MRTLTVVIPTLNEGESIGPTIDAIPRDLDWLEVDIIVVDGNSADTTAAEAEKRGARVINEPRKGYGRAYKTGFAATTSEFIATLDGDTTYPAEIIPHVLALLLNRELDFISCNRLSMMDPDAMSMTHKVGNWSLTQATNILHGIHIHDSQSGMWIFRRRILKEIRLTSDGMPLSEEIKIETFRRGLKVLEIPVGYRARIGDVKLNTMEDGIRNLWFLVTKMADFR
jgi:glycosyltransferase involved in cell wall biosynthesis